MIKKLFAIILAFCIIPVSGTTFANEEVSNSQADLVFDKFIALGLYDEDDRVVTSEMTRADFVRLVMKVAEIEVSNDTFNKTPYTDLELTGINYRYINKAYELGYLENGTKFYPKEAVSYTWAVEFIVKVMGFNDIARNSGYVKCANLCGLLDNNSIKAESRLSTNNAMKLIDNMLDVKMLDVAYRGSGYEYTISDTRYAEMLGIYKIKGVLTENSVTGIYAYDSQEDTVSINNISLYTENASEYDEYLGYYVEGYYVIENGTKVLKYCNLVENRNTSVIAAADEIIYVNGSYKIKRENEKTVTAKLDKYFSVIYNGKYVPSTLLNSMETTNGTIELIDNNSDRRYDVVKIMQYDTVLIDGVDVVNSVIITEDMEKISFEETNSIKSTIILNDEVMSDLSCISGRAVGLYAKSTGGKREVRTLLVSGQTVTGKITEINEDTINVEGQICKVTDSVKRELKLGVEYKFYLDAFGYIAYYTVDTANGYMYGYVREVAPKGTYSRQNEVLIFTQKGEHKVYELAKKVTVDGVKLEEDIAITHFVANDFVKFKTNDAGEISKILCPKSVEPFTEAGKNAENNGEFRRSMEIVSTKYRSASSSFSGKLAVNASTVVFDIPVNPDTADENDFIVRTRSVFHNDHTYDLVAYDVSSTGLANMIYRSITDPSSEYQTVAVIDRMCYMIDEDDNFSPGVILYINGVKTTMLLQDASVFDGFKEGDIVTMRTGNGMRITKLIKMCRTSDDSAKYYISGDISSSSCYIVGKVIAYEKTEGRIVVEYAENTYAVLTLGNLSTTTLYTDNEHQTISVGEITVGDIVAGNFSYLVAQTLITVR